MPASPSPPKPNQLQVPNLVTPVMAGTATPPSLPAQNIPNMMEAALHGVALTRAAIASKQEATAAGVNAAIGAAVKTRADNLNQLFKEIDKGKYTDGTPFPPQYKAQLKSQAAAEFGVDWNNGQGSMDPTAMAKWQMQLRPNLIHNPGPVAESQIWGGGMPDLNNVQNPNAPRTNQGGPPAPVAPMGPNQRQPQQPPKTYPKGFGMTEENQPSVAANGVPNVGPASFLQQPSGVPAGYPLASFLQQQPAQAGYPAPYANFS